MDIEVVAVALVLSVTCSWYLYIPLVFSPVILVETEVGDVIAPPVGPELLVQTYVRLVPVELEPLRVTELVGRVTSVSGDAVATATGVKRGLFSAEHSTIRSSRERMMALRIVI